MVQYSRIPGTPTRQSVSARNGHQAKKILSREEESLRRNFQCGFVLGLSIGILALCLVLWLWAVPTVDGCLEAVRSVA